MRFFRVLLLLSVLIILTDKGAAKTTTKAKKKKTTKSPICNFNSWKKYSNSRCSKSSSKFASENNLHKTINSALKSGKCTHQTGRSGLKFKATCKDKDTIYLKFYNFFDEDKSCKKAYGSKEIVPGLKLPPLTLDNGRCEAFGQSTWIKPSISAKKKSTTKKKTTKKSKANKNVNDAASAAAGVLVAIIVGSICAVCICIACCIFLVRRQST